MQLLHIVGYCMRGGLRGQRKRMNLWQAQRLPVPC